MANARVFDQNPTGYDRWRPRYCPALFSRVLAYARGGAGRALEVGIGTGQATGPFLRAGYTVTALEPGPALAAFTRAKYANEPGLTVVEQTFERFSGQNTGFDLLYSATAFHWIDRAFGLARARELLRPGGTLALFWNRPMAGRPGEAAHDAVQAVYRAFWPNDPPPRGKWSEADCAPWVQALQDARWEDVECRLFHSQRTLTGAGYAGLVDTYSTQRDISPEDRARFLEALAAAIDDNGGAITMYDTMDLYLARRPAGRIPGR